MAQVISKREEELRRAEGRRRAHLLWKAELRGVDLLEAERRWPDLLEEDYRKAPDI